MNRRRKAVLLRAIFFLVCLNAVSIAVYLLLLETSLPPLTLSSSLKPWPRVPSLISWFPLRPPETGTCESYFGPGFSRVVHVIKNKSNRRMIQSFFRCRYSETLRSSICELGGVRMDPSKITMAAGGENLEDVMGREEEEELPRFEAGAFQIEGEVGSGKKDGNVIVGEKFLDEFVPQGEVQRHTMRELMESVRVVERGQLHCSQWIEDPTLLLTRFEYANLFHTITDWYSAYASSRVTGLPGRPHLVFVDGHCKTPLEETWEALFSSVRYAKNFSDAVCFRHAILSPLGYETAMFKGLTEPFSCQGAPANVLRRKPDYSKTARLSEFGEMLRASFGLPVDDDVSVAKPSTTHNVLFVRREDYLAHPRHTGKVESRLSNEQEVFYALKDWTSKHKKCKINMVNGLFAHMHMKEQLQAIQEASVIIGAHGAGLTHLVSATPNTKVLEIISSLYKRPHFALISKWKGLEYHEINLFGSNAKPDEVIDNLRKILRSLGC